MAYIDIWRVLYFLLTFSENVALVGKGERCHVRDIFCKRAGSKHFPTSYQRSLLDMFCPEDEFTLNKIPRQVIPQKHIAKSVFRFFFTKFEHEKFYFVKLWKLLQDSKTQTFKFHFPSFLVPNLTDHFIQMLNLGYVLISQNRQDDKKSNVAI